MERARVSIQGHCERPDMSTPIISHAENDLLFDEGGRAYIDLFSAYGTVFLGHCHPRITAAVRDQLARAWTTGGMPTRLFEEARAEVEGFFHESRTLAGFCSTGMEASEYAIRIARASTGRAEILGFDRNMHGKSLATACLSWNNRDGIALPQVHRMPFLPHQDEAEILRATEELLSRRTVSAVFVEPIQGSGGGHEPSRAFLNALFQMCRSTGTLVVFDEVLTGFYRTGTPFFFSTLDVIPDIVLIGKAMANGFPISGVMVPNCVEITGPMLRGSTYAGNPLACRAVTATLREMAAMDLANMVSAIHAHIHTAFSSLGQCGISVRGKGAIWILDVPDLRRAARAVEEIRRRGVCVGFTGTHIRIMPAATIRMENLTAACNVVREVLEHESAHA